MNKMRMGDIAFGICATYLLGIFGANMGWDTPLLTGASMITIGLLLCYSKYLFPRKYIFLFFLSFLIGAFYYHAFLHWNAVQTDLPQGKETTFLGLITEAPQPAGNYIMLTLGLSHPYGGTLDIFVSPNSSFNYGDMVWAKGTVTISKNPGEHPVVFLPQLRLISHYHGVWWKEELITFKSSIVQRINQFFPSDQAALLGAIIMGTTSSISTVLKAQMEASGTSYIIGMYGYKLAIIIAMFSGILKDHLSRRMLLCCLLGVIVLFIFATGANISVLRAAAMASVALCAQNFGKVFNPRNALVFTAAAMAMGNATLLSDAAFQLSYLSFLGIYHLGPALEHLFGWENKGILMWKEHAMLSLSTNLAILPIVMNVFGIFSLTSFVSNILIMIPWPLIMVGGTLIVGTSFVSSYIAFFLARTVGILLTYELFIIHIFSNLFLPMPAIFDSPWAIVFYYGVLIIFAYYYAAPSKKNN